MCLLLSKWRYYRVSCMSGLNITRTGGLPSFQAPTGNVHNTAKGLWAFFFLYMVNSCFDLQQKVTFVSKPKLVHFKISKIWYPDFFVGCTCIKSLLYPLPRTTHPVLTSQASPIAKSTPRMHWAHLQLQLSRLEGVAPEVLGAGAGQAAFLDLARYTNTAVGSSFSAQCK